MKQSLFRKLVDLLLLILIVNAVWRVGPAFYSYFVYRNQVAETARWSYGRSDREVKEILLEMARRSSIPLLDENLTVKRERERMLIEARYVETLEVLPLYAYEYEFSISIDTVLARPTTAGEIR